MAERAGPTRLRCVHCREEVEVSDRYAHGDHVRCGHCGTDHKLVRGDRTRLVLGDIAPLRDALAQNSQLVARIESDLARTRLSFGIGANGLAVALLVGVYRVAVDGAPIDGALVWTCVVVALFSALLLELANWGFLAKRNAIERLTRELTEAREDGNRLRAQLRESTRV